MTYRPMEVAYLGRETVAPSEPRNIYLVREFASDRDCEKLIRGP